MISIDIQYIKICFIFIEEYADIHPTSYTTYRLP
jgi:hypothetical protein